VVDGVGGSGTCGRDCAVRSGFGIALIASASEMLVTMVVQGWFAWY